MYIIYIVVMRNTKKGFLGIPMPFCVITTPPTHENLKCVQKLFKIQRSGPFPNPSLSDIWQSNVVGLII